VGEESDTFPEIAQDDERHGASEATEALFMHLGRATGPQPRSQRSGGEREPRAGEHR